MMSIVAKRIAIPLGLVALVWIVFGQTASFDFVNYDDQNYVYANHEVQNGLTIRGIGWAFTHTVSHNWHPLTIMSHMASGPSPRLQHLTNVTLHMAATVLLFFALSQLTGRMWCSAFVAAAFAIHPLRAESVAWISERKDVLSGLFFALTLWCYGRYARTRTWPWYTALVLSLGLGLLAKSMLVTTPLVLLLLDYWPLQRLRESRRVWLEKIPLMTMSILVAIVTIVSQGKVIQSIDQIPFATRFGNALLSCVTYVRQTFWPTHLAPFYPYPQPQNISWNVALAVALIIAITVGVVLRGRRGYLLIGWGWYLIMLLPVLGLVQVGLQAHADRYTYLPQIGLFIGSTWFLVDATRNWRWSRAAQAALASITIVLLAWRCHEQVATWRDSETLWTSALRSTTANAVAESGLTDALNTGGKFSEAVEHGQRAVALDQNSADAQNNFAVALSRTGRTSEAVEHFHAAIQLSPTRPMVHYNLGTILLHGGRVTEAIDEFQRELEIAPNSGETRNNLAIAFSQKGDVDLAIAQWEQTLAIDPDNLDANCNLAWVLATHRRDALRNGAKALEYARHAVALSHESNPRILRLLAAAYAETGRFTEAVSTAERARVLAQAQGNTALVETLRRNLDDFEHREPLRD